MKTIITFLIVCITGFAQETVTDYDGNIYNTINIGNQVWLKENLKSVHYSDGTSIPDVLAYNNSDSLKQIYGLLYTWNAAVRNSTQPGVQGVCPCEWHVPTDQEWSELENYLGGASVAGGKMKDTGTTYWDSPNTEATNSSGFTGLPAGEYDTNQGKFQLLRQYAVFWTSTAVSTLKARERYLSYNSSASLIYDWYKVLNYSIRCIKDDPTGIEDESFAPNKFKLMQNYPNPFNPSTNIQYTLSGKQFVTLRVHDVLGNEIQTLVNEEKSAGTYEVEFKSHSSYVKNLPSGVYIYRLQAGSFVQIRKMVLLK